MRRNTFKGGVKVAFDGDHVGCGDFGGTERISHFGCFPSKPITIMRWADAKGVPRK